MDKGIYSDLDKGIHTARQYDKDLLQKKVSKLIDLIPNKEKKTQFITLHLRKERKWQAAGSHITKSSTRKQPHRLQCVR